MSRLRPLLPTAYQPVLRETVDSTSNAVKLLARESAPAGTIVWALQQTAGRGRRGRSWVSPPGNLYASLLIRPCCPPDEAAQLGFVTALAVADTLAELAPDLGPIACKWPNDVLAQERKIAGILLESEIGGERELAFLIIGLGINLASAPTDAEFPATSLAAEGFPPPAPEAALHVFIRHFHRWAGRWHEAGFSPVREAWRARAFALGEQISARLETVTLHGRFADIDQHGALLLETQSGRRRVPAGDVFPAR
jgi:BirA family transcriptional regulator, biotin operon repressor / biotin---[acetyl-CoA-carboxylase] ligase